jgi:hypothetical protein
LQVVGAGVGVVVFRGIVFGDPGGVVVEKEIYLNLLAVSAIGVAVVVDGVGEDAVARSARVTLREQHNALEGRTHPPNG